MRSLSLRGGSAIGVRVAVGDPSTEPGGRAVAGSSVPYVTAAVLVAVGVTLEPSPVDIPS